MLCLFIGILVIPGLNQTAFEMVLLAVAPVSELGTLNCRKMSTVVPKTVPRRTRF